MSFEKLKKHVKEKFEKEERGMAHDFSHIERVLKNAELIGKKEKANLKILKYAALLHDYVRESAHEIKGNHALESSKKARKLLLKENLTKQEIDEICHAIEAHSRSSKIKPETLEAKVLFDADKMDAIGAIGLARWIAQAEELNWTIRKAIKEYIKGIEKTEKEKFYTKTGSKLIKKRAVEVKRIIAKILKEMD